MNLAAELSANKRRQVRDLCALEQRKWAMCRQGNRLREAGAGGSNPLSPTIDFQAFTTPSEHGPEVMSEPSINELATLRRKSGLKRA